MKYEKLKNKIILSQPKHILHGLEELGLLEVNPSKTPLSTGIQLSEASDKEFEAFKKLNINYGSAIGLLSYIAMYNCPDISFAVLSLVWYSVKPGLSHWKELRKTWQFLKYTSLLQFELEIKDDSKFLEIYSDSTWGDDPDTRISQSGYLSYLHGSLISWSSARQQCVTYSLTELELCPLVDSFHEGTWLKALVSDLWNIKLESATHYIDNKGLEDELKFFGSNPKTRHTDLKMKGLRQEIQNNAMRIVLIWLRTCWLIP